MADKNCNPLYIFFRFHVELCFLLLCLVVFPTRWTAILITNWFFLGTEEVCLGKFILTDQRKPCYLTLYTVFFVFHFTNRTEKKIKWSDWIVVKLVLKAYSNFHACTGFYSHPICFESKSFIDHFIFIKNKADIHTVWFNHLSRWDKSSSNTIEILVRN